MSEREIIARLNDRCRHGLDRTGRIVITRTCLGTFADNRMAEIITQAQILAEVRKFTYPDDDRTERDHGQIRYRDQPVYFQIHAFDADLKWGSPDPTDASVTRRVMTIMVREDL
jgi:signal recognition particle subunit SEC65